MVFMNSLFALGCAALDVIARVERLPLSDEKIRASSVILEAGGPAATAAATASHLGVLSNLVASVGDDNAGDMIRAFNQRDGVNTEYLLRQESSSSPVSMIMVEPEGLRSIVWSRETLEPLIIEDELFSVLSGAELLLVDGHELSASQILAKYRRDRGAFTMLDAGTLRPGMEALAESCQLVAASKKYAIQLMGGFQPVETVKYLRSKGAVSAIVTAGKDGAWGLSDDCIVYHQSAFPVDVVDTTGAGDIFHGAWAAAWLKGKTWLEQLRWAGGAAALGCRFSGGRKGLPDEKELLEFLDGYKEIKPEKMVL